MSNKNFGIVVASISFGITCLLITALHIAAYKQVIRENANLKQENIEYKWEIEQVPYIIECGAMVSKRELYRENKQLKKEIRIAKKIFYTMSLLLLLASAFLLGLSM